MFQINQVELSIVKSHEKQLKIPTTENISLKTIKIPKPAISHFSGWIGQMQPLGKYWIS